MIDEQKKVDPNLQAVEIATDKYFTAHQLYVEAEDYAFKLQLMRDSLAEGDPSREHLNTAIDSLNRITNIARENIESANAVFAAAQKRYEESQNRA